MIVRQTRRAFVPRYAREPNSGERTSTATLILTLLICATLMSPAWADTLTSPTSSSTTIQSLVKSQDTSDRATTGQPSVSEIPAGTLAVSLGMGTGATTGRPAISIGPVDAGARNTSDTVAADADSTPVPKTTTTASASAIAASAAATSVTTPTVAATTANVAATPATTQATATKAAGTAAAVATSSAAIAATEAETTAAALAATEAETTAAGIAATETSPAVVASVTAEVAATTAAATSNVKPTTVSAVEVISSVLPSTDPASPATAGASPTPAQVVVRTEERPNPTDQPTQPATASPSPSHGPPAGGTAGATAVEYRTVLPTVSLTTHNSNWTTGGGPIVDPDHERDELKKLLLIIGTSIAAVLVILLISCIVIYRVAKARHRKANSRYYNFKKKKTNYEKVLHLQEYYGDLGADGKGTGTGTAWVFSDNQREAITLETSGQQDPEPPVSRTGGRPARSRNQNRNNRHRSSFTPGRGNYQVLAEMFPNHSRGDGGSPPDVLLPMEGALPSNSEEEEDVEGAVLDTSFGPVGEETGCGLLLDDPHSDSMRISWPTWNSSPYVTICQEDAGVEL